MVLISEWRRIRNKILSCSFFHSRAIPMLSSIHLFYRNNIHSKALRSHSKQNGALYCRKWWRMTSGKIGVPHLKLRSCLDLSLWLNTLTSHWLNDLISTHKSKKQAKQQVNFIKVLFILFSQCNTFYPHITRISWWLGILLWFSWQ